MVPAICHDDWSNTQSPVTGKQIELQYPYTTGAENIKHQIYLYSAIDMFLKLCGA